MKQVLQYSKYATEALRIVGTYSRSALQAINNPLVTSELVKSTINWWNLLGENNQVTLK